MEKIIEKLITDLTKQREALVEEHRMLDANSMNYIQKEQSISTQISAIDCQIEVHLLKLKN